MQLRPRNSVKETRALGGQDLWLLLLRGFVVFGMVYYQAVPHVPQAWNHVWNDSPWTVIDQMAALGLPAPSVFAVAFLVLLLIALLGLALGFVVRISAALFLFLVTFVLFAPLELSPTLVSQTLMLYVGMGLCLLLAGGGLISLDGVLTRRKNRPRY